MCILLYINIIENKCLFQNKIYFIGASHHYVNNNTKRNSCYFFFLIIASSEMWTITLYNVTKLLSTETIAYWYIFFLSRYLISFYDYIYI